jgi:hypothetical protein
MLRNAALTVFSLMQRFVSANAGKGVPRVPRHGLKCLQDMERLCRQRYDVFCFHFHLMSRDAPLGHSEIDLFPFCCAQSPGRTNSSAESFSATTAWMPLIAVDRAHKGSYTLGISYCCVMGLFRCDEGTFEVDADVAFDHPACDGEPEDLPAHLSNPVGGFDGAACFHALDGDEDIARPE